MCCITHGGPHKIHFFVFQSRIHVAFNYDAGINLNGFAREVVHLTGSVGQRIT